MKVLFFLISFYILNGHAGNISIVASLAINENVNQTYLSGYLHNQGNEAAKDLKMVSPELEKPLKLFSKLESNERKNFNIPFNQLELLTKGRVGHHILSFILTYKDLNGADFSAPVLTNYLNGPSANFSVSITKTNDHLQLDQEAVGIYSFKNLSDKKEKLFLRHITSREIIVESISEVELNAGEEEEVEVEFENKKGLIGSSYYYFLIAEKYEGNRIHSEMVTKIIQITKEEAFSFSFKEELPFFLILVLIGLLIYIGLSKPDKLERIQD